MMPRPAAPRLTAEAPQGFRTEAHDVDGPNQHALRRRNIRKNNRGEAKEKGTRNEERKSSTVPSGSLSDGEV